MLPKVPWNTIVLPLYNNVEKQIGRKRTTKAAQVLILSLMSKLFSSFKNVLMFVSGVPTGERISVFLSGLTLNRLGGLNLCIAWGGVWRPP